MSPEELSEKNAAMEDARQGMLQEGNLTEIEINEFLDYEFGTGAATIRAQMRRYYLIVKRSKPKTADRMMSELEPLLTPVPGQWPEQQIHDLSMVLFCYISGFCIQREWTEEMKKEVSQEHPRPLKILTLMAPAPFQLWRDGRSEKALWRAWRQGRSYVAGYGMTEQAAIDDLRFVVQPDSEGSLDGCGKPKGALIGGNMFSRSKVLEHNRRQFV